LLKTLVEAKPTLFFGVPRVYEKIREKMMEVAKSNSGQKYRTHFMVVNSRHTYKETGHPARLPAQVAGAVGINKL
jgi:long-subunit acyl-CoA synthetase (AMP-forming)